MKYDRPVWQLMHACADALPENFRYDDVRTWFAQNYPEVGEATIRAHVVGLTEGGAKHPQFERRSPLFRRVERGVYAPIPFDERGELPEDGPADEAVSPVRFTVVGPPDVDVDHDEGVEISDSDSGSDDAGDARDGAEPDALQISAEEFWPFPAASPQHDDPMAQAATARRKKREKDQRRQRKAAKREAKRQAELEIEQARRELAEAQSEQDSSAPRLALAQTQAPDTPEHDEIEAERRQLSAEREEMARIAAERSEYIRTAQAEIAEERARLQVERDEAAHALAEQARAAAEARAVEQQAAVALEAERAAVAQAEAARLQAERFEAERVARQESKRAGRLRKAARREREEAEMLERDRIERRARRKAERRARESAEQHLLEAADRRRRDEDDRRQAAITVRDELARLEQEELTRIEVDRAMRARAEAERSERAEVDRVAFDRAEQDRLAFEHADREALERDQLDREEQQLRATLSPMMDAPPPGWPPVAPPPNPEPVVRDDRPFEGAGADESFDDPHASPGGIVIVRAPREAAHPDTEPFDEVPLTEVEDPIAASEPEAVPEVVAGPAPRAVGRPSDAIVLGSIGERLRVPAPARDAFRDIGFQRARREAELSGSRWFVLSAEHGLLEPQEWMSPDEREMADIEPRQWVAWAAWVVARLQSLVGDLSGQVVHVEAPGVIAAPVAAALREVGAEVTTGAIAEVEVTVEPEAPDHDLRVDDDEEGEFDDLLDLDDDDDDDDGDDDGDDVEPLPSIREVEAQVIPFARGGSIADHLSDPRQAVSAASAASLPHHPGLYAWVVDHAGSRELNRALRLPVRAGVIFVGQVGAGTGPSERGAGLNDHVTRVQLHGRARSSTFRMTLATALAGSLGLHTIEDPRLTQWMLDHLSVAVWPTGDVARLRDLRTSVVDDLRPVLNIDAGQRIEYRDRLAELGKRLA